MANIQ